MDTTTYLILLLAAIVALAIAAFQYFYKVKSTSKTTIVLSFLRFLALFLLFLLFINPKIESNLLEVVKPKLSIAVDNSSSIKILNKDKEVTNIIEDIKENTSLSEKFEVNYFAFAEDVNELDSLKYKTNSTNISNALAKIESLYEKDNSTIILVTDGNQTLGSDYSFFRSKSKVYPIVVGDTIQDEDVKISKLNVNRYSYLNNTFPVEVFVNYNGESSISSNVVVREGNSIVFRKTISLSQNKNSEKIEFNLKANRIGVLNYNVSVSAIPNEKNKINNRRNFTVEVIDEQSKIAIISDIMHPDLGMLKRSIEANKQRKITILNLNEALKLKDYQLVIIYQPNSNFKPVFEKFKKENSNYFIITGTQTDWNFLNSVQDDFTKNTINQSEDYFATLNSSYSSFIINNFNFNDLPPLKAKFGNINFKISYETILYQIINGIRTDKPLLATFKKDGRRGAILLGENSWKWRANSFTKTKSFTYFDNFINKLVQYLSLQKKLSRLDLEYLPLVYQNDVVLINATYFDNNYTIDSRANLNLTLRNTETNELKKFPFRLSNQSFEAKISDLKSGDYRFTVSVEGQNIKKSGSFTVLDYNIEQQFTYANLESLQSLADNSNGKQFHISNYKKLIDNLKNDKNFIPIQKSTLKQISLIDWKWLLGLIVLFLSLEWFIRKYYGKI